MKAIILLDFEHGRSSAVIIDHNIMEEVEPLRKKFAQTSGVRKATIAVAGLTGGIVLADPGDSPDTLAHIASW